MAPQEEHKTKITDYLTAVGSHLRDVDAEGRHAMLSELNAKIQAEVSEVVEPGQEVTVVEEVLDNYGAPARQAALLRGSNDRHAMDPNVLAWDERVWLGVCAGVAQRLGINPNFIRLVLVVLGFVPPLLPFLMTAYLGFYAVVYLSAPKGSLDTLRLLPVLRRTAFAAFACIGLFGGAHVMLLVISRLSKQILGAGLLIDGRYNWLLTQNVPIFTWVMIYLMPIAIVSAMPVRSSWAVTLEKVVKAALALYAIVICAGIAFMITGLLIDGVEQFSDSPGTDAIRDLFQ